MARSKTGAQVMFSSLLPVVGSDIGRNRQTKSINTWLCGCCHHCDTVLFNNVMAYMAPGLMVSNGSHLSQRGNRLFAQELAGRIDRGEHIRLACDKLWDDTQLLEGQGGSMNPQPVVQRHAGDTAAQSKSWDELRPPEVVGPNKKTSAKHPRGKKECSTKKVTEPTSQMKHLSTQMHTA